MEAEKKRKRAEDGEVLAVDGGEGRTKEVAVEEKADATSTDDEVEFFAILRRIHVAVKYFEKRNGSRGNGYKWTAMREMYRTALDADGVDGVKTTEESPNGVRKTGLLDLNADPESET